MFVPEQFSRNHESMFLKKRKIEEEKSWRRAPLLSAAAQRAWRRQACSVHRVQAGACSGDRLLTSKHSQFQCGLASKPPRRELLPRAPP
jgi:hypothetical protein